MNATTATVKLTANETAILRDVPNFQYVSDNSLADYLENGACSVWTESFTEDAASAAGITLRGAAAVIGSLQRKGLVSCDTTSTPGERTITVTPAGLAIVAELNADTDAELIAGLDKAVEAGTMERFVNSATEIEPAEIQSAAVPGTAFTITVEVRPHSEDSTRPWYTTTMRNSTTGGRFTCGRATEAEAREAANDFWAHAIKVRNHIADAAREADQAQAQADQAQAQADQAHRGGAEMNATDINGTKITAGMTVSVDFDYDDELCSPVYAPATVISVTGRIVRVQYSNGGIEDIDRPELLILVH